MKEDNHLEVQPICKDSHSRSYYVWSLLVIFVLTLSGVKAQCASDSNVFSPGEKLKLDVYFKWGLLMPRAGSVTLSFDDVSYNGSSAYRYRLLFKTTSMFDHIFRMRDTIDCHYNSQMRLLRSEKRVNEGGDFLVDDLRFSYPNGSTKVRSVRYNEKKTKIDTVLVSNRHITDMLGATLFLRMQNISDMKIGDTIPLRVAIGRDQVNVRFRYAGQNIVEWGTNVKFKTRKFYMDIYDEAFTTTKEAVEVWLSDDANKVPIKIKAKLKIGAAEVYFDSIAGNRYPFSSRIVIPSQNK